MIEKHNGLIHGQQKIIVIVGPTASGKSDLALRLAKLIQGKQFKKMGINGAEIISADSRQVYRGMDIGTGKVAKKEQKIVKHHLLDVCSPKKIFTAENFKNLGEKAIKEISARNKIPIIVGGTGFYIDILLGRMSTAPVPPNPKLRAKLEEQTAEQLYSRLLALDFQRAQSIDRHNKRHLIRAIEIVISTGKPVPIYNLKPKTYNILWIGLSPGGLNEKIKKRLNVRLEQGMIKEVQRLHKQGVSWKRLNDLGLEYRSISKYLRTYRLSAIDYGHFIKSEFYKKLLRDIIRYSKRQMTWFKKNKDINWIKSFDEVIKITRKELK